MTKLSKIRDKLAVLQDLNDLQARKRKAAKLGARFQDPRFAEKVLAQFQQESESTGQPIEAN